MRAKDFVPASKPRNFVAKNSKTAGAGAHKDKKKAEKQGDVKHKQKQFEQGVAEGLSKRDQKDVAAIKAAIERLQAQLKQPNADKAAIQASIAHEKKRLALYGQGVAEDDMEEGWDDIKKFGKKAAVAGAIGLGALGAQAQDAPSGEDFLPDIVAHVTFKIDGKTISKDINLGTAYKSPGQAGDALAKFLKSKGIKYYDYSLERVKPKDKNYLDKAPYTDSGKTHGQMDTGPASDSKFKGDYMSKEGITSNG